MHLDNNTLLSDKQAVVASAVSTNVLDLKALGITYDNVQLGRRQFIEDVPFMVQVTEDFDALTTLDIIFQTDDNVGFASAKDVFTVNVALTELVAGYQWPIDKLPRGINEQFFRMSYVVNGANPTVGQISAGVVPSVDAAYRG